MLSSIELVFALIGAAVMWFIAVNVVASIVEDIYYGWLKR